jgi:hypothetical protein
MTYDVNSVQFRVLGLTRLDQKALEASGGASASQFEAPETSSTAHNELATIAVVGGIALLGSAASYFFGKHSRRTTYLESEVILPNGATKRVRFCVDEASNEPVNNQILRQVSDLLKASS